MQKGPVAREPLRPGQDERARAATTRDALQSWFIHRFDEFLTARGRRLVGWDEILEGGLAPGAVVASWRGDLGAVAAGPRGPRRDHVSEHVRLPRLPAGPRRGGARPVRHRAGARGRLRLRAAAQGAA
ncbi:family 20 glycosylhydrolase [Nonomuraea dietziae]|uniref:family 20 glycosylhydrolase n=1 Tax=Nonomuraea dietziae TaxID=65515 RepID=UPI0031DBDD03